MDDRMQRRGPWVPWAVSSVVLVLVAVAAYTFGANREAMTVAADPGVRAWHYSPFSGIWMLFVLFWVFGGLRWMWWGGYYRPWHHRRYGYPGWRDADRDDWEEWHRREHERMNSSRGPSAPSRSESQGPI